jgi:acyl transferase domain-containing protein/acyl carrier protein
MSNSNTHDSLEGVAIIGMAGRFPGAGSVEEFWRNLRAGVESISFFTDEELLDAGVPPALLDDPNYVRMGGALEGVELFDASFFNYTPREAEIMDPQQRFFLECAWESLENAGYDPETYEGFIGVYAGAGASTYQKNHLSRYTELTSSLAGQVMLGNEKDFLATNVSYKLGLRGPSINVQTACSTSLVAVSLACQSLLSYQCDMALAGGVCINVPQKIGHIYQEGGINSPDGHCRAFDASAEGSVGGSGVGIVVLKRLAEAIADGDHIHAVVKGVAINNDGSLKVGFTAPGIQGQAEVVSLAQAMAEVEPESIGYIEAHGSGTPLGDPMELTALAKVFRGGRPKSCGIGSVKTNIGHLDTAAGVAGLIKTVLALKHKEIPPSLHFEKLNPKIDFSNTPFYINSRLSPWEAGPTPRRAGVSSFGVGGTNAHAVLEESPELEPSGPSKLWQLLLLSARTDSALEAATDRLAEHLRRHPEQDLADIAYTFQVGRKVFGHRRMLACRDREDAVKALETRDPKRLLSATQAQATRGVTFMFPGLGDHYVNMALGLYRSEPTFREHVDRCCEILKPHLGIDLREVIFDGAGQRGDALKGEGTESAPQAGFDLRKMLGRAQAGDGENGRKLDQTVFAQPAVFVVNYAMAQVWMKWGVEPEAMIGYSLGEYVAACLAGVFSLADALLLVARRAQMIQALPAGAMLAVPLPEEEVVPLLSSRLSLAAVNGPSFCTVAGPTEAVAELEAQLLARDVLCRRLSATHAFHSSMMNSLIEPLTELVRTIPLKAPKIPYLSNVTGQWMTADEATDPSYWARHMCQTVRFGDGLRELAREAGRILLEVGPGQTLGSFAMQQRHTGAAAEGPILSSIRYGYDRQPDAAFLMNAAGMLWLAGVRLDWAEFYADERRRRVPLPAYPFERSRYWVDGPAQEQSGQRQRALSGRKRALEDWFYLPSWKRSLPSAAFAAARETGQRECWLIFMDEAGLGRQLAARLQRRGQEVVSVIAGEEFARLDERTYTVAPGEREHYANLLGQLRVSGLTPGRVVHLWGVTTGERARAGAESFARSQAEGFYSLLFLAQSFGKENFTDSIEVTLITNGVQDVFGQESLQPEKSTVLGAAKVIPQEYPNVTCRNIDVVVPEPGTREAERLADDLLAELDAGSAGVTVAYRGGQRWVQTFEPLRLGDDGRREIPLHEGGVYLITGGLGKVGLLLAEHLAADYKARLVLTSRAGLPAREEWGRAGLDAEVAAQVEAVRRLEGLGAEVLVFGADVAEEGEMREAVEHAERRFGRIDGVIHAAGLVSAKQIQELTAADCQSCFRPKAGGLYVLESLFRDRGLDFCMLFSSSASVLGGLGFSAYAAANIFMDSFARLHNRTAATPWLSVNWDTWPLRRGEDASLKSALSELVMTPAEGVEAFRRALSLGGATQVLVSLGDLQARMEQWVTPQAALKAEAQQTPSAFHPRPALGNAFEVPRNEMERVLADIWQEVLGIGGVGIHDNFFQLGGHSLLATRVVSRARKAFSLDFPVKSLFDAPTVAELAEAVVQMRAAEVSEQTLVELLGDLDDLTDEGAETLLAAE